LDSGGVCPVVVQQICLDLVVVTDVDSAKQLAYDDQQLTPLQLSEKFHLSQFRSGRSVIPLDVYYLGRHRTDHPGKRWRQTRSLSALMEISVVECGDQL
jgi:hypothetical protein